MLQDSESLQLRSQDLQQLLRGKEQELEQLFQKQRRVSASEQSSLFMLNLILLFNSTLCVLIWSAGASVSWPSQWTAGESTGEREAENEQRRAVPWPGAHLWRAGSGSGAAGYTAGAGLSTAGGKRDVSLCMCFIFISRDLLYFFEYFVPINIFLFKGRCTESLKACRGKNRAWWNSWICSGETDTHLYKADKTN